MIRFSHLTLRERKTGGWNNGIPPILRIPWMQLSLAHNLVCRLEINQRVAIMPEHHIECLYVLHWFAITTMVAHHMIIWRIEDDYDDDDHDEKKQRSISILNNDLFLGTHVRAISHVRNACHSTTNPRTMTFTTPQTWMPTSWLTFRVQTCQGVFVEVTWERYQDT